LTVKYTKAFAFDEAQPQTSYRGLFTPTIYGSARFYLLFYNLPLAVVLDTNLLACYGYLALPNET